MENIYAVIPSLNPDEKLTAVVKDLFKEGFSNVLIVNDGSDSSYNHFYEEAENEGAAVIRHAVNLGKGRAMKTAFNYLLNEKGEDVLAVFADSDGQHKASDVKRMAELLKENPDKLIMGCREFGDKTIPFRSRFGNILTRNVFKILCGVSVSDTQTGLRGLSGRLMREFIATKGERFEFEMNMLIDTREKEIEILELPIETIYIEENKTSHFNPIKDSLKIYAVFGKFIFSSALSFLVDIGLFTRILWLLKGAFNSAASAMIYIASISARVVSSLVNYFMNKNTVFKQKSKGKASMARYYILCAVQILVSSALVSLICVPRFGVMLNETWAKLLVDAVLFVISFWIQREWVFKAKKKGDN